MLKDSINNGPYQLKPEINVKDTDGVTDIHCPQRVEDLVVQDKLRYDSDIKVVNILLLRFLVDIYTLVNHYQTAKEIWDRVKELMKGTKMTKQELVQQPPTFQPDIGFVAPTFLPTDDPIASLNKAMIFLSFASNSQYPTTNNQLRTSSNPRTQAIIQNGQVIVQNVQGRQSQGYAASAGKNQASGARVFNTVGNAGENKPRVIRCYNCNGEGHIAKQCTGKKRVKDSEWFKDKMLLAHAQEAGVVLNDEQQDILADNHVDVYDSDCDDKATKNAIFMENLSLIGSINDDVVEPCYDSDILFEISENNKLRAQLKGKFSESQMNHNGTSVNTKLSKPPTSGTKVYSVTPLPKSKVIPKVVEKNDLSKSVNSHLTTNKMIEKCIKVLAPCLLKIESEPINAYFKNNRVMYRDYLKVTKEHVATLHELLEEARALKPLDEHIGRVSTTNASRSKPKSNTKKDRILQPSSRSKKNKVEAHHRKLKSRANKNNHVLDCNPNVKNVALSKNSDTICLSCNECLFSTNHDACVVQYLKKIQKSKVAKSAKQKVKSEWKPTGRIVKSVGLKWIPTGRLFNLVGKVCPPSNDMSAIVVPPGHILTTIAILVDVPCPKLSLRYANARESLSKCMLNMEFHPFNLHDFGFEGIIRDEELPPWKFDYLGIIEIVLWYLDFGCSKHMTRHRDKLINFVSKFIGMVQYGNDHFAAIKGYKDRQMGSIHISRVYYVEGLGHNLFSVGQFCNSDLEVAFRKHTCFVQNLEGVDLLSGSSGSNLYTISMVEMMKSSPICLLFKAAKTKSWLWHRQLSHLYFCTINQLAKQGLVKGLPKLKYTKDHLCFACQMGKSKKESHPHKKEPSINEKH
ncbi:integrase, catalytic region, zinc finger, CCHC-type containing protein [Tanacetum coccineum]